jgi:hypothetical protein
MSDIPWRSVVGIAIGMAVAAGMPAVARAADNLIVNGGFEQPAVKAGTMTDYQIGQRFPGWMVVGRSGAVAVTGKNFTANGFKLTPHGGNQFLEFPAAIKQGPFGVEQTVRTKPHTAYSLTFWVGNVYNPNGGFGGMAAVDVYINHLQVAAAINPDGRDKTSQVWQQFTLAFTPTTTETVIDFLNADAGGLSGLDDVVLTPQ